LLVDGRFQEFDVIVVGFIGGIIVVVYLGEESTTLDEFLVSLFLGKSGRARNDFNSSFVEDFDPFL
jgi:hypothetical protein